MLGGVTEGELPKGWALATFDDLIERCEYGTSVKCNYESGGTPVLRIPNIAAGRIVLDDVKYASAGVGYDPADYLETGDLLVCRTNGSINLIGRAALVRVALSTPTAFASYLLRFRLREQNTLPPWVDLFFNSHQARSFIESHAASSAGQHNISLSTIRTMTVPIPPLGEQRRIVAKVEELFSDLDAGVAALERVRANLKRYRASVLRAAVEGRLTADWRAAHPDAEPASALLARVLADRRAKWESDQRAKFAAANKPPPKNWQDKYAEPSAPDTASLPGLPKGWVWATLEQLNSAERPMSYGVLQPGNDIPGGIPLVRVCDVRNGVVAVNELKRIEPTVAAQYQRTVLRGGEVLLTIVGTIGRSAVVPESLCGANTARAVAVIPILSLISPNYVEINLRESGMCARLTASAHEVARKTLNLEDVRVACIPLAPLAEQERIVAEVEERLSVASAAERVVEANLARAGRLRQSILKRAFAGALVPQDPADEPASALLARLRASREPAEPKKTKKPRGGDPAE